MSSHPTCRPSPRTTISSRLVLAAASFQRPSAWARVYAVRPPQRAVSSLATARNNRRPNGLPTLSVRGSSIWIRCMAEHQAILIPIIPMSPYQEDRPNAGHRSLYVSDGHSSSATAVAKSVGPRIVPSCHLPPMLDMEGLVSGPGAAFASIHASKPTERTPGLA